MTQHQVHHVSSQKRIWSSMTKRKPQQTRRGWRRQFSVATRCPRKPRETQDRAKTARLAAGKNARKPRRRQPQETRQDHATRTQGTRQTRVGTETAPRDKQNTQLRGKRCFVRARLVSRARHPCGVACRRACAALTRDAPLRCALRVALRIHSISLHFTSLHLTSLRFTSLRFISFLSFFIHANTSLVCEPRRLRVRLRGECARCK